MAPKKRYSGLLVKAIKPSDAGARGEAGKYEYVEAVTERLDALLRHYGIADDDPASRWFSLAVAMANDHVPGFHVQITKAGRKPFKTVDDVVLFNELRAVEEAGGSVKNAARNLTKRDRFKGRSAEGLRQRYALLKRGGPEFRRVLRLVHLGKRSE